MHLNAETFIDCIVLVANDATERRYTLVQQLIDIFESDKKGGIPTANNDLTQFYVRMLKTMMNEKASRSDKDHLKITLLKFKSDPVATSRKDMFDDLVSTLLSSEEMTVETLDRISTRVRQVLIWNKVNKSTNVSYSLLRKAATYVKPDDQARVLREVKEQYRQIQEIFEVSNDNDETPPSLVESIDFTKKDSLKKAMDTFKARAVTGILKFGLQGLNRMFGERGGAARGESVIFNALSHMYKSGMLTSIAAWIALYNIPVPNPEGRKPLIYLASLENEAHQNAVKMMRHLYETRNNKSAAELTDDEIIEYAYQEFNSNGYTLIIDRFLPDQFGFLEFVDRIQYFERAGYEVVATIIDYINNMKKGTGAGSEASNHLAVRDLYRALCNFTKSKAITLFSAHQLNRDALKVASSGTTDVVHKLGPSMLSDSVDVQREVDVEIYMHKELNHQGVAYLTLKRGKHRYVDTTPEAHKYCAYAFGPWGIPDDIGGPAMYVSNIYTDSNGAPSNDNTMGNSLAIAF